MRASPIIRVWLVALGVTSGVACGPGEPAQPAPAVAATGIAVDADVIGEGRRSYRTYCVQCHGYYGKGDGTSAAHLEPPPRDHTDATVMAPIGDRLIAETIRFGGTDRGFPGMPAFPTIPVDEVVSLVAYVRSLSNPGVLTIDVGDLR